MNKHQSLSWMPGRSGTGSSDLSAGGFYFVVHAGSGMIWARYVRSLKEEIHVYAAESGTVRANHTLWMWGMKFLRLHYRMRRSNR